MPNRFEDCHVHQHTDRPAQRVHRLSLSDQTVNLGDPPPFHDHQATFDRCIFQRVDFRNLVIKCDFDGCTFDSCTFYRCEFREMRWLAGQTIDCTFIGCNAWNLVTDEWDLRELTITPLYVGPVRQRNWPYPSAELSYVGWREDATPVPPTFNTLQWMDLAQENDMMFAASIAPIRGVQTQANGIDPIEPDKI